MTSISTEKLVGYAIYSGEYDEKIHTSKLNAYASTEPVGLVTTKLNAYAVIIRPPKPGSITFNLIGNHS